MISEFNKRVIDQLQKIHVNKFDDMYYHYNRLLKEQQEDPQSNIPSTSPDTDQAIQPDQSPDQDQTAELQEPAEKPYPELLKIIALALKINTVPDPESISSDFNSYEFLRNFAETWIAQDTISNSITDQQAVKKINQIQQHLNNILGSAEQAQ